MADVEVAHAKEPGGTRAGILPLDGQDGDDRADAQDPLPGSNRTQRVLGRGRRSSSASWGLNTIVPDLPLEKTRATLLLPPTLTGPTKSAGSPSFSLKFSGIRIPSSEAAPGQLHFDARLGHPTLPFFTAEHPTAAFVSGSPAPLFGRGWTSPQRTRISPARATAYSRVPVRG